MEYILNHNRTTALHVQYYGEQHCKKGHYHGPAVREDYLIHYIIDGYGIFRSKGVTYHLQPRQGFLICPSDVTYYEADSEHPWHYTWIGINGSEVQSILDSAGLNSENPIFHYHRDDKLMDYFNQMNRLDLLGHGKEEFLTGLTYMILGSLISNNAMEDSSITKGSAQKLYLHEALRYIHNHYYKPLKITSLSRYLKIDRSYVYKLFMEQLGESPKAYIMTYRFRKACFLLQTTHLSIHVIASSVGYKDALTFSKAFKKIYQLSPTDYRKHYDTHEKKGEDSHV